MHRGQGLSPILANTFPEKLVARNLLLAERSRNPGWGEYMGERGGYGFDQGEAAHLSLSRRIIVKEATI